MNLMRLNHSLKCKGHFAGKQNERNMYKTEKEDLLISPHFNAMQHVFDYSC